eukprot:TRINITY_DN1885_c1_g1_i4.p1 TRINITY_DN1885_c1_g1~~TRINITY_DN1885_c1_g1_i4.p1  ORF type:complete len:598 (+),score=135.10 TRINITY_DN1885_c1_g1_i4:156-1796(+)
MALRSGHHDIWQTFVDDTEQPQTSLPVKRKLKKERLKRGSLVLTKTWEAAAVSAVAAIKAAEDAIDSDEDQECQELEQKQYHTSLKDSVWPSSDYDETGRYGGFTFVGSFGGVGSIGAGGAGVGVGVAGGVGAGGSGVNGSNNKESTFATDASSWRKLRGVTHGTQNFNSARFLRMQDQRPQQDNSSLGDVGGLGGGVGGAGAFNSGGVFLGSGRDGRGAFGAGAVASGAGAGLDRASVDDKIGGEDSDEEKDLAWVDVVGEEMSQSPKLQASSAFETREEDFSLNLSETVTSIDAERERQISPPIRRSISPTLFSQQTQSRYLATNNNHHHHHHNSNNHHHHSHNSFVSNHASAASSPSKHQSSSPLRRGTVSPNKLADFPLESSSSRLDKWIAKGRQSGSIPSYSRFNSSNASLKSPGLRRGSVTACRSSACWVLGEALLDAQGRTKPIPIPRPDPKPESDIELEPKFEADPTIPEAPAPPWTISTRRNAQRHSTKQGGAASMSPKKCSSVADVCCWAVVAAVVAVVVAVVVVAVVVVVLFRCC